MMIVGHFTMVAIHSNVDLPTDLAGTVWQQPTFFQIQQRIRQLIDRYLSMEHLGDRLTDLPHQFTHPQPQGNRIFTQAHSDGRAKAKGDERLSAQDLGQSHLYLSEERR
jgi:hypothetical protein